MIIEADRIPPEGRMFSGEEPADILELENSDDIRLDGPLHYDFKAIAVSGELIVEGRLSVKMTVRCSRCGEPFETRVTEPEFECVRELAAVDQSVDLTADIRESMLLALPFYPVCASDCRGLCSRCGANLNKGECACKSDATPGWEALSGLRILK